MNHHIRVLLAVTLALSCLSSMLVHSQTLDPSYLSEMPPPAKILSEIKGKDAEDTIERQMGAFMALNKVIDDMAYGLEHRSLQFPKRTKPDELRIKEIYSRAYADLWHKAANKELHKYDHDFDLLAELFNKFFSQSFRDLYSKADASKDAFLKAARERNSGAVSSANSANTECAAKGLDDAICRMQSAMKAMIKNMSTTDEEEVDAATPGLVLNDAYGSQNLSAQLFTNQRAWVHCGEVFLQTTYQVESKGNQILVNIENGRDSFTFRLQPDETTLTGSGEIVSIHGYAPPRGGSSATTGTPGSTNEVTTSRQRELTPLEAQQYPGATKNGQTYTLNETTTSTEYTLPMSSGGTPWQPKSAPCRLAVLKHIVDNSSPEVPELIKDWIPELPKLAQGLRLIGNYDGVGGASIKFFPEKAKVSCGATIAEHQYEVKMKNGQVSVFIFGNIGAEAFTLRPDGSLAGSGAAVSLKGCNYASLSPRGRSGTSVGPVSKAASPPVVKNLPESKSTASEPPSLMVNNSFVGQAANPLSGRELLVLKQSFEEALRIAGFQDPAGTPVRRSAVAIWAAACKNQTPQCKQGIDALQPFYAGKIRLDVSGTAKVSGLPTGNFWILGLGVANGQHFVWNLPLVIKPGSNSIQFEPRNATMVY